MGENSKGQIKPIHQDIQNHISFLQSGVPTYSPSRNGNTILVQDLNLEPSGCRSEFYPPSSASSGRARHRC